MKATITILLTALLLPAIRQQPLIQQSTQLNKGITSRFQYLEDGRIAVAENSKGFRVTYTYNEGQIIKEILVNATANVLRDTFILDKNGLAIQEKLSSGLLQECTYNSNSQLTMVRSFINGSKQIAKDVIQWNGADEKELLQYDDDGKLTNRMIFYYTDSISTITDLNIGRAFTGKKSLHLLSKSIAIQTSNSGTDTTVAEYRYRFDLNKRVVLKVMYSNGVLADSTAYSYM